MRRGRSEEMGIALDMFPEHLRERLEFDLFVGDSVLAGVTQWETAKDGRSFRNTAHVTYESGIDGRTTVVIPKPIGIAYTVHELAHVLDQSFDFELNAKPVTWYATRNKREAFAEAVTALLVPGYLVEAKHVRGYERPDPYADKAWSQTELVRRLGL